MIAALSVKVGKNGNEVVNIASTYGKGKNWFKRQFDKNLLFANTTKGQQFLNTHSLQLGWDFTSGADLSARNIKTETDLAQYRSAGETEVRKSHFGEHENSNTGKSRITKHAETINQALGRLANRVELVSDVRQALPDSADRILSNKYDGAFDSATGKVYLFAENLTPERAAFVAWHELGHRGVADSAFRRYRDELRKFGGNSTVAKLADEIQAQRPDSDPANQSRDVALLPLQKHSANGLAPRRFQTALKSLNHAITCYNRLCLHLNGYASWPTHFSPPTSPPCPNAAAGWPPISSSCRLPMRN